MPETAAAVTLKMVGSDEGGGEGGGKGGGEGGAGGEGGEGGRMGNHGISLHTKARGPLQLALAHW